VSADGESLAPNDDATMIAGASMKRASSETAGATLLDTPAMSMATGFRAGWLAARDMVFAEIDTDAARLLEATVGDPWSAEPDLGIRSGL
jgi:hypothetical protein